MARPSIMVSRVCPGTSELGRAVLPRVSTSCGTRFSSYYSLHINKAATVPSAGRLGRAVQVLDWFWTSEQLGRRKSRASGPGHGFKLTPTVPLPGALKDSGRLGASRCAVSLPPMFKGIGNKVARGVVGINCPGACPRHGTGQSLKSGVSR